MCCGSVWPRLSSLSGDERKKQSLDCNVNKKKTKRSVSRGEKCANVEFRAECGIQRFIQALLGLLILGISGGKKVCEITRGPNFVHHPGEMVLWATLLFLHGAGFVGSMTGVPGVPENVTVMFLNPTSVRVSWSTSLVEQVEKYDVTYKPTDARSEFNDRNEINETNNETYSETYNVTYNEPYNETYDERMNTSDSYRMVRLVAGNSDAVTLSDLQADTQYQLVITAVRAGKKYRSRPIVFRTLEPPRTSPQQDGAVTGGPIPPPPPHSPQVPGYIQVRGVEVGIVVMILIVWAGAIALFFNRWGKIRMLLPYQPDYKEQLKVPGTGVCPTASTACTQHSSQHACSQMENLQHLHWSSHRVDSMDSTGGGAGVGSMGWPRPSRPRVNSAIDVAGFLSQEFLRRHGSTSRLCRKVRSADNLPLATRQDSDRRESQDESTDNMDRVGFLPVRQEEHERFVDIEPKRLLSSIESTPKDMAEISLIEVCPQPSPSRECSSGTNINSTPSTSSALVSKRFPGWRFGGSHEYVRCPVRQPTSIDERFYRRSCEPDFSRLAGHHHHVSPSHHLLHHHSTDINRHSRSCEYSKRTDSSSIETQHFGLPILSVSEPSPPDERDRLDDYL